VQKRWEDELATIAVTIGVPLAFFLMSMAYLISAIISAGVGLLAFYLGYETIRE
jgi:hypothetical protein